MDFPIRTLSAADTPPLLAEIPDPPKRLYARGNLAAADAKLLAVVGSRQYSSYGKQAVEKLVGGLRGYPITVVSGLALGIDALAHRAALNAGLHTIAVPGSGIDDRVIYPRTNARLAYDILKNGGALLSEFEPTFEAAPWCFPQRNRIMAGMSHATLVIEATERSGTLITSRLATDYNRDVLAVPGSIFSANSAGPHMLIRLGATPVRSPEDILEVFGIEPKEAARVPVDLSQDERKVLVALREPMPRDELIRTLGMSTKDANVLLSIMELRGHIAEAHGVVRSSF